MSSGSSGIASVEIENGSISISEVFGQFAPTNDHDIELQLKFMTHGSAEGNIHAASIEQGTTVFLTSDQLCELISQLKEYEASRVSWLASIAATDS
jgi:hypothetical protein